MKAVIRRYELTDAEWERLKPYFPDRQAGDKGRPRKDSRQILNGILWIARSGAAWRDLPERYGAWQTWIVNSKSDRFYKVRDLLNSVGDKYRRVPNKRILLNQCT